MAEIKIYTNESVPVAVAEGLKLRNIKAWSARDSDNLGLSDEEQLTYAYQERAVIYTHDNDFLRIAKEWEKQGKEHWGIIYVHEQKLSIGECIRRLMEYVTILEAEDMKNYVEFL